MDIKKFREIIAHRIYVEDISDGEWYEEIEKCQEEVIKIITEDIPSSIEFLKNECTADEYSWISEGLDEIADVPRGPEFVECFKSLTEKFSDECKKYNVLGMVELAENVIKWNKKHSND